MTQRVRGVLRHAEHALEANVERLAGPGTVVVFDDVLPRRTEEAARERASEYWAVGWLAFGRRST